MRSICFALAVTFSGTGLLAQVDGTIGVGEYTTLLAQQSAATGFGNNSSELNTAHASYTPGGSLFLGFSGNVEPNGNTFVLFLDVRPGGGVASTLPGGYGVLGSIGGARADDWGTDTDGDVGVFTTPAGGSILSPGFNPDYAVEISCSGTDFYLNIIDLLLPNEPHPDRDVYIGSQALVDFGGTALGGTYGPNGASVTASFNNSNALGVNGQGDPWGDPLTSTTGIELELGAQFFALLPGGTPIRLMGFITNGGGDYLSNQFLPGLPDGTNNLGVANEFGMGDPLFDARDYTGDMFLTVVPTPGAGALALPVLLTLARRRR